MIQISSLQRQRTSEISPEIIIASSHIKTRIVQTVIDKHTQNLLKVEQIWTAVPFHMLVYIYIFFASFNGVLSSRIQANWNFVAFGVSLYSKKE